MGSLLDMVDARSSQQAGIAHGLEPVVKQGLEYASSVASYSPGADYLNDPWRFLCDCVYTLDEADRGQPVKRFPVGVCVPCARSGEIPVTRCYLSADELAACPRCATPGEPLRYMQHLTDVWHRKTPPVLYVPKPRRMRVSWWGMAVHTWLAASSKGAFIPIVSTKEDKSGELVERCKFILERIPKERFKVAPWVYKQGPPRILFPSLNSQIIGIAEGPDQLRQYTCTAIFGDEIGFWKWPRATYAAALPTLEGGGQMTLVSSAAPGFWRQCCEGEISL